MPAEAGLRVPVGDAPDGAYGREWLRGLLADLADDGLVELDERGGPSPVSVADGRWAGRRDLDDPYMSGPFFNRRGPFGPIAATA